jgi:hypothetical protein
MAVLLEALKRSENLAHKFQSGRVVFDYQYLQSHDKFLLAEKGPDAGRTDSRLSFFAA